MSRLLLLIAVGILIYLLLKTLRRRPPAQPPAESGPEDMVRCAQCGVHLPRSESLLCDGQFYCSEAHRPQRAK